MCSQLLNVVVGEIPDVGKLLSGNNVKRDFVFNANTAVKETTVLFVISQFCIQSSSEVDLV